MGAMLQAVASACLGSDTPCVFHAYWLYVCRFNGCSRGLGSSRRKLRPSTCEAPISNRPAVHLQPPVSGSASVPPSSRCPVQGPGSKQPAAWAGQVGSWWAEVEAACGGGSGSAQEAVDAAVAGQAASAARLVVATCDLALKSRHAPGRVAPSQASGTLWPGP